MSMNTCVLMAEIVKAPELRYTPDNLAIAEMLVQFPGLKDGDAPCTLKAVMFGDRGVALPNEYQQGDLVVLEGALRMNMIERQEGFKEKRAEMRLTRIHRLSGNNVLAPAQTSPPPKQLELQRQPVAAGNARSPQPEPDFTDIPF